ncbi:hypothetical protein COLO4_01746, partial [Corchorus olitorius]
KSPLCYPFLNCNHVLHCRDVHSVKCPVPGDYPDHRVCGSDHGIVPVHPDDA